MLVNHVTQEIVIVQLVRHAILLKAELVQLAIHVSFVIPLKVAVAQVVIVAKTVLAV